MRKTSTIGFSIIALAASGWIASANAQTAAPDASAPAASAPADTSAPAAATPPADTSAPAKPAKPMHKMHHAMKSHGKMVGTRAGDAAVDDLNAKSLTAAKSGQSFSPPKTPINEPAATAKPMKHHHMMKKTAAKAPEAAAPASAPVAPDAATPAAPAPDATPK